MLYAASEAVRDSSMLDMTDIVTWLVTCHSIMSYSTVSNVTSIKFTIWSNTSLRYCNLTRLDMQPQFPWPMCLTFKYFPKVSKNKNVLTLSQEIHQVYGFFTAGCLTRLRAPGSRFCSSWHFGDGLLWASVHGREERHKMDRPGQVYQETNMQTTR